MKKSINEEKCKTWSEMLLALTRMARELTDEEYDYTKANLAIAFGRLKLKELEADIKEKTS